MKMKKICLAVGSAFAAGMASQAFALTPAANPANTLDAFATGSTAVEPALRAYVRSICTNGTLNQFTVSGISQTGAAIYTPSPANQNQIIWQCSLTSPFGTKTSLTLRKSSGDSGEGLTAANGLYPVNFLDTSSPAAVAGFTCGAQSTTAAETGLAGFTAQTCTYSTSTGSAFISAAGSGLIGIADVEPALLNNAIAGAVPDITKASVTTIAANVWGVAVTTNLRNKLQAVQNLSVGDETVAQMPSLSKTTLYSIFTGQFNSGSSNLTDGSNNPITGAFTGSNGVTAPSTTSTSLYFLRRPESSGTMTSFKTMFGDVGCSATNAWAGDGVNTTTTCTTTFTNNKRVLVWQSTGNLLGCMQSLNTAGRYAVGIAATSNNPFGTGTDRAFRYIKVDGAAPSLFNVAIGKYPYYTETTLLTPNAGTQDPNSVSLQPTGDAATFYTALANGLRSPSVIAKVNSDNTAADHTAYSDFQAGLVLTNAVTQAIPTVTTSYPIQNGSAFGCTSGCTTGLLLNPVIPSTRNTANANSCQPVLQFSNGNQPVNVQ